MICVTSWELQFFRIRSTIGRILQQMNGRRDLQMFTEKM